MKINGKPDGGGGGEAIWGGITGTLSNQTDLMNKFNDYATQTWVESQEFATESWVSSQQFMTLSTDPLLQHNPDRQVGPMSCNFITVPYSGTTANRYVQYISDGEWSGVYFYRANKIGSEGYFYKFNESTFNFDFFAVPTMTPSRSFPLWKTPDGQFAIGNKYLVSFTSASGSYIADITEYDMGGQYYLYSDHKDNIIYVGSNCYMINYYSGLANQYNPNYFWDVVYTTNCSFKSLPRYKTYVEGNCVYTSGGVMYRFVEDIANQTVNVEALETPLYPLIDGSVPDSDRIHKIGDYYIYYIKPYVYKWVPGNSEWELLDFNLLDFSYHPCGVDYGEYMFGNGYRSFSQPNHDTLLVWNFTSSIYGESIYSSQEDYYDKIGLLSGYVTENRVKINTHDDAISGLIQSVSQINDEIGVAINITNNILS